MVREAREAAGMTQEELAELCGFDSHSNISRLESGKSGCVEPELMRRLVEALPTLRPVELLQALGYPLRLPSREWSVPGPLIDLCREMSQGELALLLRLARGLRATADRQHGLGPT